MNDDENKPVLPFGDWRVRLGIVLGVLVFCGAIIVWDMVSGETAVHAREAWWSIRLILVATLGAAAFSDWARK